MKVVIDKERCMMAGECCYNHPWLFAFGDDDFPVVQSVEITSEQQRKEARQSVQVCPSGAISVIEYLEHILHIDHQLLSPGRGGEG
jgi:ferredoxin